MRIRAPRAADGFTLIELVIVIILMSVLAVFDSERVKRLGTTLGLVTLN